MKQDKKPKNNTGAKLVIPFFITMGILTVVSFLLPLRPTRSQMERRNLTPFPEFSWAALTEGSYFDHISLWFSDTFPGREGWLTLSSQISSLHGYSEIAIAGDLNFWENPPQEITLEAPKETLKLEMDISPSTQPDTLPTEIQKPDSREEPPRETIPEAPKETLKPEMDTPPLTQPDTLPSETQKPDNREEPPKETIPEAPKETLKPEMDISPSTQPETLPTETQKPDIREEPPKETIPEAPKETQKPEMNASPSTQPETLPSETQKPDNQEEPPKETIPEAPKETLKPEMDASPSTQPDTLPSETQKPDNRESPPEETQWGGVDAGDDIDLKINGSAVIQIGNTAFNAVGFSESSSKSYAAALNSLLEALEGSNVRIVSAPAPTAVGILIEPKYLEKLQCANQDEIIRFLHNQMDEGIVKVDTYAALMPHNNEYIYFRTDHHWTARGAYYAYVAICEALGFEAVPLEECKEWDQGEFQGSLYWNAPYPRKLKTDTLYAYVPKANLELRTRELNWDGIVRPLIQDMTERGINSKYSAFLFSDNPMVQVTNYDLPDGPTALVIKDSFGNALVPFLAQNYSKVYAIDYRKFHESNIQYFLRVLPVNDVIFAPYLIATQSIDGAALINQLCS